MKFFQKIRFLFSRSDDFSWLTDLDYRDRLTKRLLQLVQAQPAPEWVDQLNLRTSRNDERPSLTLSQIYAELGKAIEAGHGGSPLAVEVAYVDGLLCGSPRVLVSGIELQMPKGSTWGRPHLYLETNRSVVMLDRETFTNAMKHDELLGPYT